MQPGEIRLKDVTVLQGLMERNFAPLLVIIICKVAETFGFVLTESWREKKHRNDLHGTLPVRAVDLRFWCYENDQKAYEIMHWINKRWVYDPKRPEIDVAIIHDSGQGIHFHLQCSPNTISRQYI